MGAKWGDFGSFCVWTMSVAVLMGFLAFWPNRVGTDESNSIFGVVDLEVRGREQLDLTIPMGGKRFYHILTVILLKLIQLLTT